MPTLAEVYRAVNANGEFLRTLKTYLANLIVEEGMTQFDWNNPLPTDERKNRTEYKAAQNIGVTTTEAEIDLGGTYDEISILNTGSNIIEIKFNDSANDPIGLSPQGTSDSSLEIEFEVSKIYHKTVSGTSTMRYIATR